MVNHSLVVISKSGIQKSLNWWRRNLSWKIDILRVTIDGMAETSFDLSLSQLILKVLIRNLFLPYSLVWRNVISILRASLGFEILLFSGRVYYSTHEQMAP